MAQSVWRHLKYHGICYRSKHEIIILKITTAPAGLSIPGRAVPRAPLLSISINIIKSKLGPSILWRRQTL